MRTRHLNDNGQPKYTNRLIDENSPYLLQHAHNPVDWHPWGDEAFEKAAREDKPVFLSIGYSTCHWCHVMEHESFDDEEVADYLNEHFVAIKLDREQRPDLDEIYMTGVQLLTGQGGWPMSNFLTTGGKPFFAGTYYPKAHFMSVLERIADVWKTRREDVEKQASEITAAIEQYTAARAESAELDGSLVGAAASELLTRFDEGNGGLGGAPKFPNESMMLVLLEDWTRNDNERSLRASTLTLDRMYQGGIYDQVGGGFHRYTVDQAWQVPHFEKMLYNQAQLVRVYLKGWQAAGVEAWCRVVEETVEYVLRDMTGAGGMFFSATDADSEGEEGRFFTWTPDEIDSELEASDAQLVKDLYGVMPQGNFEGRNIFHLADSLENYAAQKNYEEREFFERLGRIREQLYRARETRIHPARDEKIITAWNGMMITSLALAGFELDKPEFIEAAVTAADRVWESAFSNGAGLRRIVLEGQASIPGNLEDYANLAEAFMTLYAIEGTSRWLSRGRRLVEDMLTLFYDAESGGFFASRDTGDGPLITKPRSPMDGATASGNSVALSAMILLSRLGDFPDVERRIHETLAGFSGLLKASPSSFSYMVLAAESFLQGQVSGLQFAARGHVRAHLRTFGNQFRLEISMDDDWHISAADPGDAALSGTRIEGREGTTIDEIGWPPGEIRTPGSLSEPVSLYQGRVRIEGRVAAGVTRPVIALHLQACSDEVCLAPEVLEFRGR